ncbi:polysaccharide deacetylase [Halanaerobium sp. DL-01]|nr:polysaccharide deacetylase [Halanaerobium sp. DL-01]
MFSQNRGDFLSKKINIIFTTEPGETAVFFRPPYGEYNNTLINIASQAGYQIVPLSELIFKNDYKIKSFDELQYQISGGEYK